MVKILFLVKYVKFSLKYIILSFVENRFLMKYINDSRSEALRGEKPKLGYMDGMRAVEFLEP